MKKRLHESLLPSLEDALSNVKNQRGVGMSGLAGEGLSAEIPEFTNPHEVSHTHPFTDRRDDEE